MTDMTPFETTLRDEVQVKNIPNASFGQNGFSFGDYFDTEAFRESFDGKVDPIEDWVDWAFEPWELYLGGLEGVSITRHGGPEMYWCDVLVQPPTDEESQRLFAKLVADAWKRRQQR